MADKPTEASEKLGKYRGLADCSEAASRFPKGPRSCCGPKLQRGGRLSRRPPSSSVLANFKGLTRQINFARIAAMASKARTQKFESVPYYGFAERFGKSRRTHAAKGSQRSLNQAWLIIG